VDPHALFSSVHKSTHSVRFIMVGYPFISSHTQVDLQIHSDALIKRVWRYTGKLYSDEFGDALGGRDRAALKVHLEVVMEGVWRCTWRP